MDQQLGVLCGTLSTATARSIEALSQHDFHDEDSTSGADPASNLREELRRLQTVATALGTRAQEFDSGRAALPQLLWTRLKLVPVSCGEQLGRLLQFLSELDGDEGAVSWSMSEAVSKLRDFVQLLRNSRTALSLASDAMAM